MPGKILHRSGHQLLFLLPHLQKILLVLSLVIQILNFVCVCLILLGKIICRLCINKTLAINIGCGIRHLAPHLEDLLPLQLLPSMILSPEPLKKWLFVGASFSPVFPSLLLLEEFPCVEGLFINDIIRQLFFFAMQIPHFFSLIHHLKSDWIYQMIRSFIHFHNFFLVHTVVWNILLHHFHYFYAFFFFGELLFLFVDFVKGQILSNFLTVFFNVCSFLGF